MVFFTSLFFGSCNQNYCPSKEAAMVIIVVSLPCTAHLWGALIAFCTYTG